MAVNQDVVHGAAHEVPDNDEALEGEDAEVAACDGYVYITLPAGQVVTGPVAEKAAGEFEKLARPGSTALLLDVTGVESITRSARNVFGSAKSVSAVAVLGATQVDRVIANFLLGGDLPACPTRYFSSAPDALEWLESRAR